MVSLPDSDAQKRLRLGAEISLEILTVRRWRNKQVGGQHSPRSTGRFRLQEAVTGVTGTRLPQKRKQTKKRETWRDSNTSLFYM